MNLLILKNEDFINENTAVITGRRVDHLNKILKAECGQSIKAGMLNGLIGEGEIISLDKSEAKIVTNLNTAPTAPAPLTLVLALPRPPTLRKVLQGAVEMGVKEFHLIQTRRVEKSFWQSSQLREKELNHQLELGLEQCVDTVMPNVHFHKRFKPFVEDILPGIIENKLAIVADPSGSESCPLQPDTHTVLVVGPEGGFIPYEVDLLQKAGCKAITLGQRILRVENAVLNLLGKLI